MTQQKQAKYLRRVSVDQLFAIGVKLYIIPFLIDGIINYSAVPESLLESLLIYGLSCGLCGTQRILLG